MPSVTGPGPKTVGSPVFAAPRFRSVARALASVPVVTAALGPVAGLPASRVVASHFSVMSKKTAQVLIAGPAVVERALREKVTKEELGGPQVHGKNGVADSWQSVSVPCPSRRVVPFGSRWELTARAGAESGTAEVAIPARGIAANVMRVDVRLR